MNLTTIEMPVEEAKERLREYEEALRDQRTAEDEGIAMAYRAAARGMPVIQLSRCIEAGGFFDNGLPKLAIARANATTCWVRVRSGEDALVYADKQFAENRGSLVGTHTVRVPVPIEWRKWASGSTVVPLIPPKHRPKRTRISNFHILWEVEEWTRVPPVDPALIRHIRGDLWSVVATWDLTEIERAVLSAR